MYGCFESHFRKKLKKNDYIQNIYGGTKEAGGRAQAPYPQRTAPKVESDVQEERAADEKLSFIIGKAIEVMKERAKDGSVHVVFGIPESQNKGHMFFRLLRPMIGSFKSEPVGREQI